jgi:hypothetical protein
MTMAMTELELSASDEDRPMHIVPTDQANAFDAGLITYMVALCGVFLSCPADGADIDAPLCQKCYALSDWTHDMRTPLIGYSTGLVATTTEG